MAMKTLEEIKQLLKQSKSVLQENYRVTELGIFGSAAEKERVDFPSAIAHLQQTSFRALPELIQLLLQQHRKEDK